jgi:hypothetical protein
MGRRTDIDWGAVQVDVSLGAVSMRQIAKKHGIAESNLRAKAHREGWSRGTGEAVRQATQQALAATAMAKATQIGAEIGAEQVRLYEAGLKEATLTAVEVSREHQMAARRGMAAALGLLSELEVAAQIKDLIASEVEACRVDDAARAAAIDKLLGLRARVESLDRIAGALSKFTAMEREAHGMDEAEQRSDIDEFLLKIHADRQSRQERATSHLA